MPSGLDNHNAMNNMNSGRFHSIALHPVTATPRQGGFIYPVDMIRRVTQIALIMATATLNATIVDESFLDEVALIESNMDSKALGDRGAARGAYQFHAAAWAHANAIAGTNHPHISAHNWFVARNMARAYLMWLEDCISEAGYRPTKISLYMAYNMGLSGSLRYAFNHEHPELPRSRKRILERAGRMMK